MEKSSVPPTALSKPLVRAEAVAEHLSCSEANVLRLARAGKIPAVKISNGARAHWRFDIDDVRRFLSTTK